VLARLEQIVGVESAEIDRRGELLRLRLAHPETLVVVTRTLEELGFSSDPLGEAHVSAAAVARWYGRGAVGELSREEAGVIARRVVGPFVASRALSATQGARVGDTVARALYECFVAHTLTASAVPDSLREVCARAVEMAVRPELGIEGAAELARLLREDLARPVVD